MCTVKLYIYRHWFRLLHQSLFLPRTPDGSAAKPLGQRAECGPFARSMGQKQDTQLGSGCRMASKSQAYWKQYTCDSSILRLISLEAQCRISQNKRGLKSLLQKYNLKHIVLKYLMHFIMYKLSIDVMSCFKISFCKYRVNVPHFIELTF